MTVLYIILGFIALILLIAAMMPAVYSIEKTITVNSSPQTAYDKVANFNHYKDWNPWQKMEPTSKQTVTGNPGTIGHKYEWEGKKIGTGSLTVKDLKAPNSINIDLQFLKPWKAEAYDNWKFEDAGNNQTKITWSNGGPLAYPMARLMGPMINKNLNTQFEEGLRNLKTLCEK
jgi:ribosome-associated toxin RatA of RatAB toxin-antitoxin module